jgi:levansucrase
VARQLVPGSAGILHQSVKTFADFADHTILEKADGFWYNTSETCAAAKAVYSSRDPEYWRDPETGSEYVLFTANAGDVKGPYNGAVSVDTKGDDGNGVLEPPLVTSAGVNSQLEHPHLVKRDGALYLFFSTHAFTYAPTVAGPDGLHGFQADAGNL